MNNVMEEKIIFTTGGTGGHIYPALAIAKEFKKRGSSILFVGTKHRMEREIVPNEGYNFIGLDVLPLRSIKSFIKMLKAIKEALRIVKNEKPTKIIGFGNYISIPILVAAKLKKIPYYLQEQNSTMGMANKYFYKGSQKTFLAFENTLDSIAPKYKDKFVVTGNPLREKFYSIDKYIEREKLGIMCKEKMLFVIGGSLGAKNINQGILKNLEKITIENNIKLFWGTGKENYDEINGRIRKRHNLVVKPYFENAAEIMAASDLVISRAGASTISELIQLEKPALMIPYDFVGQKENADVLEFVNGGKMYTNDEVQQAIEEAICLIKEPDMLEFMGLNIKSIKKGNATENIINSMKK
mgnify:FL=1